MSYSTGYIIKFATAVCVVCSIGVAGSAVLLRERQDENKLLDRYEKVLSVAGLVKDDESLNREQIKERFARSIITKAVELESGEYSDAVDPETYDQRRAARDPAQSTVAVDNPAKVARLPKVGLVYLVKGPSDEVQQVVLPIEGKGLWSTLYGFIALKSDFETISGITYYEHAETPGLGGEVDNPKWKKLWEGRKAFGPQGDVAIQVIKGAAGPVTADPHKVDGLSGATITSRSVTNMLHFWLGENGFGPYIERMQRQQRSSL